ncbi:SAM-dependent methyltransferase [Eggerthella sp. NSJ-70]|uniref:SAM-dependent methyltransferase n=1 Tax=Eggerthella hominis TaxID=2763043 RepID=A0ABR7BMP3_9ACTN|nr:SAM-dependent methyltransferase [Eggerthella hominis]MBC5582867.1 SAM-dependent methyltransferase [Eggerthella hominis]
MANDEFGDFQTPFELADACLGAMARVLGLRRDEPYRVLEPTCGTGSFMRASAGIFPRSEVIGVEIQGRYATSAARYGSVIRKSIFDVDFRAELSWKNSGPLIVIGNPPWVTATELGRLGSANLPKKSNFKGKAGLDALLGGSNFDIAEYVILQCVSKNLNQSFTLGMLCKTQVARNVMEYSWKERIPVVSSAIFKIDALKWFKANVDACWFVMECAPTTACCYRTRIYESLSETHSERNFGIVNGSWVSNIALYESSSQADGTCPYVWRSGLKHDAVNVLELTPSEPTVNRLSEPVDVEQEYVFPYLKATDVHKGAVTKSRFMVIVPQTEFGEDTDRLRSVAPKLWNYLDSHGDVLDGRRSSIYRKRPRFSVFGLGDYTWAKYKVAVSGLHKTVDFRLIGDIGGKPVVVDDTCYLLPFDEPCEAAVVCALLNSEASRALIESLVFWDSKRPISKKLLSRIDVSKIPAPKEEVLEEAARLSEEIGVHCDAWFLDRAYDKIRGSAEERATARLL